MANERFLMIKLADRHLYSSSFHDAGVYFLEDGHKLFILPLEKQDLDSGSLVFGIVDNNGKILSEKCYYPFISSRQEELKSALKEFEDLVQKGKGTIGNREEMELLGKIEPCIRQSEATIV